MTYEEQLSNQRILQNVEADFQRNPHDPSLRLLKSQLQSDPSQTKLGAGWFDETFTKLQKGVDQGICRAIFSCNFTRNRCGSCKT